MPDAFSHLGPMRKAQPSSENSVPRDGELCFWTVAWRLFQGGEFRWGDGAHVTAISAHIGHIDQAGYSGLVWKQAHDLGSSFDCPFQALERRRGVGVWPVVAWKSVIGAHIVLGTKASISLASSLLYPAGECAKHELRRGQANHYGTVAATLTVSDLAPLVQARWRAPLTFQRAVEEGIDPFVDLTTEPCDLALRHAVASLSETPCIACRKGRKVPIPHDQDLYRERHERENSFARRKDWRRAANRSGMCPAVCLSACAMTAVVMLGL